MNDDTGPRTGDGASRTTAGSLAPRVPFLTPVDGVDLGPAGSLIQARAGQRALRAGERATHPLTRPLLQVSAGAAVLSSSPDSAAQALRAQLQALEQAAQGMRDAAVSADASALLANGRFLTDRFGASSLDLPG